MSRPLLLPGFPTFPRDSNRDANCAQILRALAKIGSENSSGRSGICASGAPSLTSLGARRRRWRGVWRRLWSRGRLGVMD